MRQHEPFDGSRSVGAASLLDDGEVWALDGSELESAVSLGEPGELAKGQAGGGLTVAVRPGHRSTVRTPVPAG